MSSYRPCSRCYWQLTPVVINDALTWPHSANSTCKNKPTSECIQDLAWQMLHGLVKQGCIIIIRSGCEQCRRFVFQKIDWDHVQKIKLDPQHILLECLKLKQGVCLQLTTTENLPSCNLVGCMNLKDMEHALGFRSRDNPLVSGTLSVHLKPTSMTDPAMIWLWRIFFQRHQCLGCGGTFETSLPRPYCRSCWVSFKREFDVEQGKDRMSRWLAGFNLTLPVYWHNISGVLTSMDNVVDCKLVYDCATRVARFCCVECQRKYGILS